MTVKEALQSKVSYPINSGAYDMVLIEAGLNPDDIYNPIEVTDQKKKVDLCFAGLIDVILIAPDVSEGGYRVSNLAKKELLALQDKIFIQYGVANPNKPTVRVIHLW